MIPESSVYVLVFGSAVPLLKSFGAEQVHSSVLAGAECLEILSL